MSTDITNALHELPPEILRNVLSNLSLSKCLEIVDKYKSTKNTEIKNKIKDLVRDRYSVHIYLSSYIPKSVELLECMLLNDIYLSGSIALNYFTGDPISEDSDIDFYATNDKQKLYNFMEHMKKQGTIWYSIVEYFELKLEGIVNYKYITLNEIMYFRQNIDDIKCSTTTYSAIKTILDGITDLMSSTLSKKSTLINSKGETVEFIYMETVYDQFSTINGSIKYQNTTRSVQIMIPTDKINSDSIPDLMLEFDATMVQCAITGMGVFHMYVDDAYNKTCTLWDESYATSIDRYTRITNWKKQYKSRGFIFKEQIHENIIDILPKYTKRCLGDSKSYINNHPRTIYSSSSIDHIAEIKLRRLHEYRWLEHIDYLCPDKYTTNYIGGTLKHYTHKVRDTIINTLAHQDAIKLYNKIESIDIFKCNTEILYCDYITETVYKDKIPDNYIDAYLLVNTIDNSFDHLLTDSDVETTTDSLESNNEV